MSEAVLILINPFTASGRDVEKLLGKPSRGENINKLPPLEVVRQLTSQGKTIIILDNMIDFKIAKSVLDSYYGARTLIELKEEAKMNNRLKLFNVNVNYYDWNIDGEDVRDSPLLTIYIDYTKYYKLPPNLTDDLVVMATVEDFKVDNRKYLRDIPPSSLFQIFEREDKGIAWVDPLLCPSIIENWPIYELLLRSLRFYVKNDFHEEDSPLPFNLLQTNIIKDNDVKSYAFAMNQPLFKAFIHYNNLLPDIPRYDKTNNIGTGKTPTVLMTQSNQYRRLMTEELAAFFRIALEREKEDWVKMSEFFNVDYLDFLIRDIKKAFNK